MVKQIKNKKNISYKLIGIELIESSLNHPKKPIPEQKQFHFEIKLEHKFNQDNQLIIAIISIAVLNEQKDLELGKLTASCIFKVENLSDHIEIKNNQIIVPDDFIAELNSISVSTARGILFSQFKGTFLHNAFLPIIDPNSFNVQK